MSAADRVTLAEPGCYGCLGTGTMQGFGFSKGIACPCVATCEDCDAPFAWARDDERPPPRCPACAAEHARDVEAARWVDQWAEITEEGGGA